MVNPDKAAAGALGPRALPIFAQVIGLLTTVLASAILISVIVVLSSPAPPQARHSPGAIAAILSGSATAAERAEFSLSHMTQGPADNVLDPEERELRDAVAKLMQVPAEDVRAVLRSGGPLGQVPGGAGTGEVRPPPRSLNPFRTPGETEQFSVSLRQQDGTWLTVSGRDDLLLDPWQRRALLWFLGTAVVVALLGYGFAKRIAAPIIRFSAAAERLGRDPNAPALELGGPAEIVAAANALNEMQERLRRYVDDRTAMIAAIAHDLRTPLTRLRFRLETAPEPMRAKAVADIEEMEAMVGATLDFVRDATRPGARHRLELRSLLESIADNMADTGEDVVVEPGAGAIVVGDPAALRRLFANLLDNAVRYGDRARVSIAVSGGEAIVTVDDNGPGLQRGELEQAFEPFYRSERSRNRATGGVGLGLAVVRSIAHLHGGQVDLANLPAGGLRATTRLPLSGADNASSSAQGDAGLPNA